MPEFSKTDLELSMTLDGSTITTAPNKGAYTISVTCDKGATGYWDYDAWAVVVGNINEVKVKCAIAFKTGSPKFNEYIMAKSEVANSGVEKITHEVTEQTPALTDYRYVGANPSNYVYFGCEENTCTEDDLYRIIGVIPTQTSSDGEYESRVKLIKASNWEGSTAESGSTYTLTGKGYRWNIEGTNKWESSSLKEILNTEYYNSLGEYKRYIDQSKWYLGAPTYSDYITYTTEQIYRIERSNTRGKSVGSTSYVDNIGLMYPSDYGYSINGGINGEVWTSQVLYNNRALYQSNAWLYQLEGKYSEWAINPEAIYSDSIGVAAWRVHPDGYVYSGFVSYAPTTFGVRPTFYLKSSAQYASGDGTIGNPYRIRL